MGMIEDKHFSSSNKRLQTQRCKHRTRCKTNVTKCSKGSNQWKAKCKPGFKLTLLDLCKDRIKIDENETKSNDSIEKEIDSMDYIEKENNSNDNIDYEFSCNCECGDVANESNRCYVYPQERCFMPKRELQNSCKSEEYTYIEEPMAKTVCGSEDREIEEYEENCCELDGDESYDCEYCEEYCDEIEYDNDETESIDNKIRFEFEELMNGCFSVDRKRLAEICEKYTLYDECVPLWLDNEREIYGDENRDCYCNSHEGTPWADIKKKISECLLKLIDYKTLYGDITCMYDGDHKTTNSTTQRLESGLVRDWCLCLDKSKSKKKLDTNAGGDTGIEAFNDKSTCYGDCLPHKRYCNNTKRRLTSNTDTPKEKEYSFCHTQAQNRNCNHPYTSDGDLNNTDDPEKKEELFYDEEVDELFVINAPTMPDTPNEANSADDIYFQSCNDENNINRSECSSESILYTNGSGMMPSYGKPIILTETEDAMVERVTEGINKFFNLVEDLPKSGAFAYRSPLGHREEELKVTLMNCQNGNAEGTDVDVDTDTAKQFYDETSTNANCNAEEIDFGNESNSESMNNEDSLFEESEDDDDGDVDSEDNDEEEEDLNSTKVPSNGELLNEVNKCILKESALVTSNTAALMISSSQESSESQDLIDGCDAIGMSRSNSDNQSESESEDSDVSSHEDDEMEPKKSRKRDVVMCGLKSVFKSWLDNPTDLHGQKESDKTEKSYTLIKQQGWRSPTLPQDNETETEKNQEQDNPIIEKSPRNQTSDENKNGDSPMIVKTTLARNQSIDENPDPSPINKEIKSVKPLPLNQVGKGDENTTQNIAPAGVNRSPKVTTTETNFSTFQGNVNNEKDNEQHDSPDARKASGMFSYKPPSVPEKSPERSLCDLERPSYVLSPKARKLIMESRYGKTITPVNKKAKNVTRRRSKEQAGLQAVGDHGEIVRFNPPLTKKEIQNAETACKDIRKAQIKKTHIQELKDQTRGIHRPGRLRKPKRVSNKLEDKSWSNMGTFQDDDDDEDVAVEHDSMDNPEVVPLDVLQYDENMQDRVMMPKAYRDGKDLSTVSKKVIVPRGYTMQRKVTDESEIEEMNQRREQLRIQRREMMATLTSKAKDQIKPKLIPADRPVSPINDAASKFASRAKDEYLLKKPTVAVHLRGGNSVREGSKKIKHAGGRGHVREPIINQSNDGRYSWAADRRGSKDFYKKYGGDYQTSADSPFSQLFDEKQRKEPPKKRFGNQRYSLKKLDPEFDPYDIKLKKSSYSDEEDDDNRVTMPYAPYQFNQLTHNAKAIAQQRNQKWRPRVVKREPIRSPTEIKTVQNEDKFHELITHEAEVPDEPVDGDMKYKMMTFKIKSKQDTAQIMPVGGANQAAGEDTHLNVAAVNMYKAAPEERPIKQPTLLPTHQEEGQGFLSKINPLRLFWRQNPEVKMCDMGDFAVGQGHNANEQNKSANEDRTTDVKDSNVVHQGSSVDVAITAPCGLATEESRDAWKTDAERLKQQRREKLKNLMESKRRKEDSEFYREDHKRYNRSNNRDNSDGSENKAKVSRAKSNVNNHPTSTGWRDGMQKKKQEGQVKYNANNNCFITEENSEEKSCKQTSKIDFFIDHNTNASSNRSRESNVPLDEMLERSFEDGEKIKSTIELLIEWYLISLVVLLILFLPALCPCLFQKVFICPVPSICTVISSIFMAPVEIVAALLFSGASKKDSPPSPPPPPPTSSIFSAPEPEKEESYSAIPEMPTIWSSSEKAEPEKESSSWFANSYGDTGSGEEEKALSKIKEMLNAVMGAASSVARMSLSSANIGQSKPLAQQLQEDDAMAGGDAGIPQNLAKLRNSEPLFHFFIGWEQRQECDIPIIYSFWLRATGAYPPHCL